jgi:hypothetical protein
MLRPAALREILRSDGRVHAPADRPIKGIPENISLGRGVTIAWNEEA